jgi:hypothetical protein
MKGVTIFALVAAACLGPMRCARAADVTYYVDCGADAAIGDARDNTGFDPLSPLATLQKAMSRISASVSLRAGTDTVTVNVRGTCRAGRSQVNVYLPGAANGVPIVIQPWAPDARAAITCGLPIPAWALRNVTDPVALATLSAEALQYVRQVNLTELGISNLATDVMYDSWSVWWAPNGATSPTTGAAHLWPSQSVAPGLSRKGWPTRTWSGNPPDPNGPDWDPNWRTQPPTATMLTQWDAMQAQAAAWNYTNLYLAGLLDAMTYPAIGGRNYCHDYHPVVDIVTSASSGGDVPYVRLGPRVNVCGGTSTAMQGPGFFDLFNFFALLDTPSEYVVDPASNMLYFWPPDNVTSSSDPAASMAWVGTTTSCLNIASTNVTVKNLDVVFGYDKLVNVDRSSGVLLDGLGMRYAVVTGLAATNMYESVVIMNGALEDIGSTAATLSSRVGYQDPTSGLQNMTVNLIGTIRRITTSISTNPQSSSLFIRNSTFTNMYGSAISHNGPGVLIEYNTFADSMSDALAGSFISACCGSARMCGTRVQYNTIVNVPNVPSTFPAGRADNTMMIFSTDGQSFGMFGPTQPCARASTCLTCFARPWH